MLKGSIIYTHLLTEHVVKEAEQSAVVIAQKENPKIDVLTGLPFRPEQDDMTDEQKKTAFNEYLATLSNAEKAEAYVRIQCLKAADDATVKSLADQQLQLFTDKDMLINMIVAGMEQGSSANAEIIKSYFEDMELDDLKELMRDGIENGIRERIHTATREGLKAVPDETKITLLEAELTGATVKDFALYYDEVTNFSASTYEDNLIKIGSVDLDSPYTINLYASTFENKDVIVNAIDEYNDSVSQEKVIEYTDFFGFLMSSITTIINAITYVLIAFVAISLIVSSIMIGVITLISVQERTKEIGILRAIGASKRDVSSMFNAETIIIGLASGIIGVGVTYILCLPINLILHLLTGIAMLNAQLPIGAALILIGISVLLTLISGIIPARSAAKKDPVVALRTE
jgi:putative ABC transport system permease protein